MGLAEIWALISLTVWKRTSVVMKKTTIAA